jgi:hypothetical protein
VPKHYSCIAGFRVTEMIVFNSLQMLENYKSSVYKNITLPTSNSLFLMNRIL